MNLRDQRALKKLLQDPDRWWQADMQRREWFWAGIRRLAWCFLISFAVVCAGIYARTHGGN